MDTITNADFWVMWEGRVSQWICSLVIINITCMVRNLVLTKENRNQSSFNSFWTEKEIKSYIVFSLVGGGCEEWKAK